MKNREKFLLIVLLILFIIDMIFVWNGLTSAFDETVYNLLPRGDIITSIMKSLTFMGSIGGIAILAVGSLIFMKSKKSACFVAGSALSIATINWVLKQIVRRTRPIGIALITESGFSFPSGHSITSIVFYGFIIHLVVDSDISKSKKIVLSTILSIMIFGVGLSRIYLGVHYATDVLGGFFLGGAYLICYWHFYKLWLNKEASKKIG